MRFKIGEEIVCTMGGWPLGGPKENEVVTMDGRSCVTCKGTFIFLKEYPEAHLGWRVDYNDKYFAPLMDISELVEILESEPITTELLNP